MKMFGLVVNNFCMIWLEAGCCSKSNVIQLIDYEVIVCLFSMKMNEILICFGGNSQTLHDFCDSRAW